MQAITIPVPIIELKHNKERIKRSRLSMGERSFRSFTKSGFRMTKGFQGKDPVLIFGQQIAMFFHVGHVELDVRDPLQGSTHSVLKIYDRYALRAG
jgi:hypothetical protein